MQDAPTPKVLLIDDNSWDLRYYATLLRARGYDVVTCSTYAEGVRRLEATAFRFVIVSQGGPGFEGRVVLERAVEIDRSLPVLVLTRLVAMSCYLEAMQLGAVDYVQKHVHPEDFVWIVETHLKPSRVR